jgi:hypothetical protein
LDPIKVFVQVSGVPNSDWGGGGKNWRAFVGHR